MQDELKLHDPAPAVSVEALAAEEKAADYILGTNLVSCLHGAHTLPHQALCPSL